MYLRYYQLSENAIDPDMVGSVSQEIQSGIYRFVPPHLLSGFPQTARLFMQVRFSICIFFIFWHSDK